MALKAVLIDAGNTLLYENPSRFEIYAQAARSRGVGIATDAMHDLMRLAHAELPREIDGAFRYTEDWFVHYIERVFHRHLGVAPSELQRLREELFGRFADPGTFVLFPGAHELLEGLRRRGLRVGIVSNWSQRLPGLLARLGVAERVDFVLASALERVEKPDPAIFERALGRAGVEPSQAVHAGDDLEKDVAGAGRAGLRAVLVDHTGRADGHGSVQRVRSLPELARHLEGLQA